MAIPFSRPSVVGNEEKYLMEVLRSGKWAGRGPKTQALEKLGAKLCGSKHAFFVTSGSSALEVGCLLAGIGPGDEVIVPSFEFVSGANAVVLRGGRPVFADIDKKTWNINSDTVLPHITSKTRAIIPVHYGGSAAGVDDLRDLCKKKNIFLIEDAAQSLGSLKDGKPIGSSPWVTCFSLHDTKNLSSGEGGLIMTDDDTLAEKIEVIIEKGTDRQRFFRGQVDKYTWVALGSSYIASDLLAAVALAQFEKIDEITTRRRKIFSRIREGLKEFDGDVSWQYAPEGIETNGHVAAFVVDPAKRQNILSELKAQGITAIFHYVPLHDSPFSKSMGFAPAKDLPHTRWVSEGIVRLPLYYSMDDEQIDLVISHTKAALKKYL